MAKKELENITMATSKPMQRKIWKLDKSNTKKPKPTASAFVTIPKPLTAKVLIVTSSTLSLLARSAL